MEGEQLNLDFGEDLNRLEAAATNAEAQEQQFPGDMPAEPVLEEDSGPQVPTISTADAMGLACKAICDFIANRRGEHWKITVDEAENLGIAYGALLDAYIPVEKMGPTLAAISVSAIVFGPRVMIDRQLQARQKEVEGKAKEGNEGDQQQD